jgi:hypothetical protein
MLEFFSVEYTDVPLQIFGPKHLTVVAAFVVFCLSFIYFRSAWNDKQKRTMRIALCGHAGSRRDQYSHLVGVLGHLEHPNHPAAAPLQCNGVDHRLCGVHRQQKPI